MVSILIVDDNASFRAQAARLCESEGFRTTTAASVSDLATALSGATPDLALVDIELPQIPGHRLGALIRSRGKIPIVLVSALSEDRLRRLFEASDADGWICKPLTRDKLIAAVTRFVTATRGAADGETQARAMQVAPGGAINVLLIEDEPMIADRLASALASTCSVTTVADGDVAIHETLKTRYDCILLDLMLPHLSGFDVLRHLIVRQPELLKRTIIMTAASDESLQFIDRATVGGVLRKPFEVAALPDIVAQAVAST
jgi:two-component system NtrC family sensor kinase